MGIRFEVTGMMTVNQIFEARRQALILAQSKKWMRDLTQQDRWTLRLSRAIGFELVLRRRELDKVILGLNVQIRLDNEALEHFKRESAYEGERRIAHPAIETTRQDLRENKDLLVALSCVRSWFPIGDEWPRS